MDSKKLKAMAMSYFRAAFAAVAALYLSGITEPKILLNGFIAGLIGPAAKALDRSAKEYGLGAVASDVIKKAEADALAALAENSKKVAKKTTKSKK